MSLPSSPSSSIPLPPQPSIPSPIILFARGILARLTLWPTLRLAVQQNWGGPHAAEKQTWMAGVLVDLFEESGGLGLGVGSNAGAAGDVRNARGGTSGMEMGKGKGTGINGNKNKNEIIIDEQYVEELLLQIMNDEFEVRVEDGSAEGVARDLVLLWGIIVDESESGVWFGTNESARGNSQGNTNPNNHNPSQRPSKAYQIVLQYESLADKLGNKKVEVVRQFGSDEEDEGWDDDDGDDGDSDGSEGEEDEESDGDKSDRKDVDMDAVPQLLPHPTSTTTSSKPKSKNKEKEKEEEMEVDEEGFTLVKPKSKYKSKGRGK